MDEMKLPFVSKELCEYLREAYSLPAVMPDVLRMTDEAIAIGYLYGINAVMERLEGMVAQQEGN